MSASKCEKQAIPYIYDSIYFLPILSAPVDLLLRRGGAGCATNVAISRCNKDVTVPGVGFQHVEYFHASSARRNRAQTAQRTQLLDELTRRRRDIVENMFARKV